MKRRSGRRDPGERLTPDVAIRGRMPTPLEYKKHLELLRDVKAGNTFRWLGKDMSDLEHEVWIAASQNGHIRQRRYDLRWELTPYGETYLRQRSSSGARDRPRPSRSSSRRDASLVETYLRHFYDARDARPNSPAYKRHMELANRAWRRMSEAERGRATRYMSGGG